MQLQPELRKAWDRLCNLESGDELRPWIEEQGGDEGLHLEFKQQLDPVRQGTENQILKSICAFANSDGGILLIGVRDRKQWDGGLINAIEKDESQTIRDQIRDNFIGLRPPYEVKHFPNLAIIGVLVRGNNRDITIISQSNGYIGAFRRKGKVSDSLTNAEIASHIAGQKAQYDTLIARYKQYTPHHLQYSQGTHRESATSALFISALPVHFFRNGTFNPSLKHIVGEMNTIPPIFSLNNEQPYGSVLQLECTDLDEHAQIEQRSPSRHLQVLAFGNGNYLLITWSKKEEFDERTNTLMLVAGLYGTFALSNLADNTTRWAIQGRIATSLSSRSIASEPILFQSPQSIDSNDNFRDLRSSESIHNDTYDTIDALFHLLGQDILDYLASPSDDPDDTPTIETHRLSVRQLLCSRQFLGS